MLNGEDLMLARRHIMGGEEVKQMNVNMLVDPDAFNFKKMYDVIKALSLNVTFGIEWDRK